VPGGGAAVTAGAPAAAVPGARLDEAGVTLEGLGPVPVELAVVQARAAEPALTLAYPDPLDEDSGVSAELLPGEAAALRAALDRLLADAVTVTVGVVHVLRVVVRGGELMVARSVRQRGTSRRQSLEQEMLFFFRQASVFGWAQK
jgi:hypothetical protein